MALIALLAAFALAGGVGPSSRSAAVSSGPVSIELTYPAVLRTGMRGVIEGRVINRGRALVSPVMALDTAYADRVSDVSSVRIRKRPM